MLNRKDNSDGTMYVKATHEQKAYTLFGTMRTVIIWSASAKGALFRYMKKYNEQPDSIMRGALIN